jgi:hypothetical protein
MFIGLFLDKFTALYPLREKMFKAFFKISLSSFTRRSSASMAMYACLLMVSLPSDGSARPYSNHQRDIL